MPLGSGKQLALVVYLLLHRNQAVRREALVDALWAEDPPASAAHSLDVYLSRLRKALPIDGLLETQRGTVRLNVPDEAVDVSHFEAALAEARRAADPDARLAAAEKALGLWRGRALTGLGDEPFARIEGERLEEERRVANEERLEALLELGRHEEAVAPLQALITAEPLRERPRRLGMLALYRAGRQGEALELYRDGRRILHEELGLEPSRELRELEAAILRHDESLTGHPPPRAPQIATLGARLPRRRRSAVVAVVALALTAAVVALVTRNTDRGVRSRLPTADSVAVVDPRHPSVKSDFAMGGSPTAVAAASGAVWIAISQTGSVVRIDPSSSDVRQTVTVGEDPTALVIHGNTVWVANAEDGTVSRIDSAAGKVVQTVPVGVGPSGLAYEDGAIWVTNAVDGTLSRIEASTGRVTRTFPVATGITQIAAGFGRLWIVSPSSAALLAVNPRSGEFDRIGVGVEPAAVTVGMGAVWVANRFDATVSKVDPHAQVVIDTVNVGTQPAAVVSARGGIWVGSAGANTLSKIDEAADAVVKTVPLGNPPQALAADGSRLYAALGPGGSAHRGGTLGVAAANGIDFIDPALAYSPDTWAVLSLTNDGLVAFRRTGGVQGIQLVPDLASTLPSPQAAGTSYTFHLRPGVRYSDGSSVQPADFRRAIERLFEIKPSSPGAPYYADIVGADRCQSGRRCDLSRGIQTDSISRTITFHLTSPDGDFLTKLALTFAVAVPAGTPSRDIGTKPLPATGPYEISTATVKRITLVRNPTFHEWSPDAKPDGFPDVIALSEYPLGDAAARSREAERSPADVALQLAPLTKSQLANLLARYPQRIQLNTAPVTAYFFLNTHAPPFDHLDVRRAVQEAFDPQTLTAALGPAFAPTCDLLPPALVSRRTPCRTGGPLDVKHAQELVRNARQVGRPVSVWVPTLRVAQGRYMVSVLDAIGLHAQLRTVTTPAYFPSVGNPRAHVQVGFGLWQSDFPTTGAFLEPLFRCSGSLPHTATNLSRTCDPTIARGLRRAGTMEAENPPAATVLWQRADAAIQAHASVVPMYNPQSIDFVGGRVANYEYNPQWGALLDQLWVR